MNSKPVIATLVLLTMTYPGSSAIGENSYFWSPLEFGGGIELQYSWSVSQGGQGRVQKLKIEFVEHFDGQYDVVATLTNGKTVTVTERGVGYLYSWALEKIRSGPLMPTVENLPMTATVSLIVTSMTSFWGISKDPASWRQGFSAPHPNFPEVTVTVSPDTCRFADLEGRIFKLDSAEGSASACISPDLGLPLTLKGTSAAGETIEYALQAYVDRKLVIPELFHKGEPDGFDNIRWGTQITAVPGLTLHNEDSESVSVYRKSGSMAKHWGVPFKTIDYYFRDGKFAKVVARPASEEDWEVLRDALFREYGRAYRENDMYLDGMDTYVWKGEERTTIRLQSASYDFDATVELSSNELAWSPFEGLWDDLFDTDD